MEKVSNTLNWFAEHWEFVVAVVSGTLFGFSFFRWYFSKELRCFKNLKRDVYFLRTGPDILETAKRILEKSALFNTAQILDLSNDTNSLQTLNGFSVFVIGYSNQYPRYEEIVRYAKSKSIPIIVLAQKEKITDLHMGVFQEYVYFEMCNTTARMLTTIFNLSIVTPHEKD